MKNLKRITAFVLAAVVVFACCVPAFADVVTPIIGGSKTTAKITLSRIDSDGNLKFVLDGRGGVIRLLLAQPDDTEYYIVNLDRSADYWSGDNSDIVVDASFIREVTGGFVEKRGLTGDVEVEYTLEVAMELEDNGQTIYTRISADSPVRKTVNASTLEMTDGWESDGIFGKIAGFASKAYFALYDLYGIIMRGLAVLYARIAARVY